MPTFIWVRDKQTRHEFDVREDSPLLRKGLVEPVKPKVHPPSPLRRRQKYRANLAGQSVTQNTAPSSEGSAQATTEEI